MRQSGHRKQLSVKGDERDGFLSRAKALQKPHIPYGLILKHADVHQTEISGYPLLILSSRKKSNPDALLYLYGGAFIAPPSSAHFMLAAHLSQFTGCDVYFPLYPLLPDHPIHEAVELVIDVINRVMTRSGAGKTCLIGFSSGANLALYSFMYIHHEGIDSCFPHRLILNSPLLRLPASRADYSAMVMKRPSRDAALPLSFFEADGLAGWMVDHEEERYRYLADVLSYDLHGLPDTDLFYGSAELSEVNLAEMEAKCQKELIRLKVHTGKDMMHCWGLYSIFPEGVETQQEYVRIINSMSYHPVQ